MASMSSTSFCLCVGIVGQVGKKFTTKNSMNNELLQTNPFFQAMLDHIPKLERSCVEKEWILCIPQLVSLPESHKLSLNLLKSHVLLPNNSNVAEGNQAKHEFTTLSGLTITRLNEKELFVQPQRGSPSRVVTILFKEIVYCGLHGNEAYTLLCISRPLQGSGHVPLLENGQEVFAEQRSAEEWMNILFTTVRIRDELSELEKHISMIKDPCAMQGGDLKSYVAMRKQAVRWTQRESTENETFQSARVNARYRLVLQTAYESCIALQCHSVIFATLAQQHLEAENDLQVRLHDLRYSVIELNTPSERAGLTRAFLDRFQVDGDLAFQSCVAHLQQINVLKSPLDKLIALKQAAHALKDMQANVNMDDALPLFLLAMLHAAPGLLLANLHYMTDFAPRAWLKTNGELAFHGTVFQGAVSLIQNHTVIQIDEESLLRNLVVAGGSGLGVSWVGGAAGTAKPPQHEQQLTTTPSSNWITDSISSWLACASRQ